MDTNEHEFGKGAEKLLLKDESKIRVHSCPFVVFNRSVAAKPIVRREWS